MCQFQRNFFSTPLEPQQQQSNNPRSKRGKRVAMTDDNAANAKKVAVIDLTETESKGWGKYERGK